MMRKSVFIIASFFIFIFSRAQTSVPEKIVAALDSFTFLRPQEKTYLQTDRSQYVAGETIWFNCYVTLQTRPTILSKVVYVDLLDPSGFVIQKKMLAIKGGVANGNMDLDSGANDGNYLLRCYTLWMLNFPSFITEKQIRIFNSSTSAKTKTATTNTANISFFPEGGDMIDGVNGVVAFKALNEKGLPAAINGELLNAKNEKILSFTSLHDGMGSFEFTPKSNEVYRAVIHFSDAVQKTVQLPQVKEEGIVLTVDNSSPGRTFVKCARGEKNQAKYNNLLVVAQLNYEVAYMGQLNLDENLDAVAINKKTLLPGIMQITVLSEEGQPLAERLVFIANHSIHNELLNASLFNPEKRKKNIISLDTHEFSNLKAGISITNGEEEPVNTSILSAFLLSSDIKGHIHDPGFYFRNKDATTLKYLDLVMMTHGWRRFNLPEIMASQMPPLHYPFETGLSVTGKVLESNGKTALLAGKINLIVRGVDSTHILSESKTNTQSAFVIPGLAFNKEAAIYYQGTNTSKPGAIVSVKIDSNYYDTLHRAVWLHAIPPVPEPSSSYVRQRLDVKEKPDSFQGKTLGEVVVKAKKRSEEDSLNALYATDIFYHSDQDLILNEKINYYDIWQFLRMKVAGIAINQTDTGMQVNFTRYAGLDLFSENTTNSSVQFFLNEVPVNIGIIDALSPSDIALVKIFKGVTGIALGADRGAIALYTHKGRSTRDWRQKGFDSFKKSGYSVSREFYAMDYSKANPDSINSDIRPTLYWNPEITIKNGQAIIEFYNDDRANKFRVIIEGMDENGKLLQVNRVLQ